MKNPIIVALDVASAQEAAGLVSKIGDAADVYKVGMELYAAAGPAFVRELLAQGWQIFLDLKLYDIPETVKRATAQIAEMGPHMLTVHAIGQVMRGAVEGRASSPLKILGVSVLTSFDQRDLEDDNDPRTIGDVVDRRVRNAAAAGIDGIVCSPLEVRRVRATIGPKAVLVTPGVRSAGKATGDQKRVATPAEAIANGADYLVIGRQITRAADPRGEALRILDEIGQEITLQAPMPK